MLRVATRPVTSFILLRAASGVSISCSTQRSIHAAAILRKPLSSIHPNEPSNPTPLRTPKGASLEAPHPHDNRVSAVVPSHTHGQQTRPLNVMLHPVYTEAENHSVQVFHREPQNLSDKTAIFLSSIARWGFDFVSGYKHKEIPAGSTMSVKELREQGYIMNEKQWLARIIFLETIAGVPGMVAAALRHLRSLRLMQRDNAWINTLLQEAENERMHLMSFMTLTKPSIFFRAMILGAQGVFWNVMFFGYLLSPKTCHRFVGTIEEEAVLTYSRLIKDLEAGLVPEWENEPAPQIAIEYWRLPQDAKLIDMIYAVRSDESTHRFVNHSLANLKAQDVNPFAMGEPSMITKGTRPGFERDEAMNFILKNQEAFAEAREKAAIEGGDEPELKKH